MSAGSTTHGTSSGIDRLVLLACLLEYERLDPRRQDKARIDVERPLAFLEGALELTRDQEDNGGIRANKREDRLERAASLRFGHGFVDAAAPRQHYGELARQACVGLALERRSSIARRTGIVSPEQPQHLEAIA